MIWVFLSMTTVSYELEYKYEGEKRSDDYFLIAFSIETVNQVNQFELDE